MEPSVQTKPVALSEYSWVQIITPAHAPESLGVPVDLDPGETEAITLALELKADLILMDERKGTLAARQLGLTSIGVIGILVDAKHRRLIPAVLPLIDELSSGLRFFVSPSLREKIAALTSEI